MNCFYFNGISGITGGKISIWSIIFCWRPFLSFYVVVNAGLFNKNCDRDTMLMSIGISSLLICKGVCVFLPVGPEIWVLFEFLFAASFLCFLVCCHLPQPGHVITILLPLPLYPSKTE